MLDRKPLARTDLADLGPDAIVADVLGKRGRNAVTKYTGISEDAHDIMSQATGPRLANRDELLEETLLRANERNKPIRREAYEKAAKSGEDLAMTDPGYVPLPKGFEEILAHPVAKDAYAKAESIVEGFKIAKDSTGGELARLDMTQRLLQDWAEVAMKNGNKTNAELYGSFANAIKEKADTMVPDYPVARKVAENFAKEKEALIKQSEAATKVFKKTEKAISPRVTVNPSMPLNVTNLTLGLLSKLNFHAKRASSSKSQRKQAPEIARILASKEIPDRLKQGLVNRLLKGAPLSGGLLSNIQYGGPR